MSHLQLRRRYHCLNHRAREIIQSLLERPLRMPWRLESYRIWSVLYSGQITRFVLWPHFQSYLWVGPYLLVNARVFSIALPSIHFGREYDTFSLVYWTVYWTVCRTIRRYPPVILRTLLQWFGQRRNLWRLQVLFPSKRKEKLGRELTIRLLLW